MIRINDARSNYDSQIVDHDLNPQGVYIRIGNPIEHVDNPPPSQRASDIFTECHNQTFFQHQDLHPTTDNDSNINTEHLNAKPPFENHNPKPVHFHVEISRNLLEGNDKVSLDTSQNPSEIQRHQNQRSRPTVLRHSSSVTNEEVYIDRCQKIQEELSRPVVQPTLNVKHPEDEINVLNPEEMTSCFPPPLIRSYYVRHNPQLNQQNQNDLSCPEKYHMLKRQLQSKQPIFNRRIQNHKFRELSGRETKEIEIEDESIHTFPDESIIFSERFSVDPSYHPYVIAEELTGEAEGCYSPEDLTLRYQVVVFLWILLGERRLLRTGYPSASIHLVLWRVVHICCSVAGVKSAAAVPLPDYHNCGDDMLCFRDHVHRFLEVCAPTRDLWKQFGWASLTVDAVMRKIYKEELLHVLLQRIVAIPTPIRMAMRKLATLEREENECRDERTFPRTNTKFVRVSRQGSPNRPNAAANLRQILPKPQEKKKRGRPIKIKKTLPDTAGRIQRVMLWRFIMNLLEEPSNKDCIHWVKREEGIFRILNTDWLARIWGRRHGNPRMTYEKMARAMRTYYRSKVLQPVPRARNLPRKLVYKFNPALVKKIPLHK